MAERLGRSEAARQERINGTIVRWPSTGVMVAVALVVSVPCGASAEGPEDATWSIGVGVGQMFTASSPAPSFARLAFPSAPTGVVSFPSASAALVSPSPRIGLSLQVERRVGQASWLIGSVRGHHSDETGESPMLDRRTYADTIEWQSARTEYGAALGLRHVLNPGGIVELGGLLVFDVVLADLNERSTEAGYDTEVGAVASRVYETEGSGWYAGARLGLTAERTLTQNLAVRLTVSVLEAGWQGSTTSVSAEGGSTDEVNASEFRTGLRLMPVVELRLAL